MEKEKNKISFNLSPSSLNLYYESPLLFYLTYIAKVPDDTPVPICYGLSGSLIHKCLEKYAKKELDKESVFYYFASQWEKLGLHSYKDIKENILKQEEYLLALIKGIDIIDQHENHITEEIISLDFKENENFKIKLKGIIDLQATHKFNNQPVIIDYKTSNSINEGKEFQRQALFYNFLLNKKKNFLPFRTTFHYLKLGIPKHYTITKQDILSFEEELNLISDEIISYGNNISKFPIGKIDSLFNSKKQACLREIQRRKLLSII
jgi:RecB family exonuclease